MPFVIVHKSTGTIVGSPRFWKIDRVNRKMEVGHTWLADFVQRTGVNTEAKWLLLTHAFESMHAVRAQLTTDELNEKSHAAILRHERIMPDGRKRNSVRFSIIDTEWQAVKAGLEQKLGH